MTTTDENRCPLCGGRLGTKSVGFRVQDGMSGPMRSPDGGMYLVAAVSCYRDVDVCSSCAASIQDQVIEADRRREHERKKDWDIWEEDDKTFAYNRNKHITWELLPSGRPKKVAGPLEPPWNRLRP